MELEEYKHEKQLSLWRHSGFRKAYLGGGKGGDFFSFSQIKIYFHFIFFKIRLSRYPLVVV